MMNHPIISITTDFGQLNGFVGVMKGVIWGIAPAGQIADITHDIPPQNVRLGAYALWRAVPFFPPGSIHIAVVDPGVGTHRRPIGAQLGSQRFILPDNGLITPMLEDAEKAGQLIEIVHLNNPAYWLPEVSHTFHGRDIFAPTGAHLAAGVPCRIGRPGHRSGQAGIFPSSQNRPGLDCPYHHHRCVREFNHGPARQSHRRC
jgi:S-adenosyl-L-methionine hydrolase (adenosine-forming)